MLDYESTVSYYNDTAKLSEEFVDALGRRNAFDMDRVFMKLVYEHLGLISETTMSDDMSETIRDEADSISLDAEMLRSIVGKFYGKNLFDEDLERWDKLKRQRDEALEMAKESNEISKKLLKALKRMNREHVISAGAGLFLGGAIAFVRYKLLGR